jgi:tetraacyldisaccharide 4'-kinase
MTRADLAPEGRLEEIRARVKKVRPDLPVGEVVEEVVGIEPLAPAPTHRFPRPGSPAPAGPLYAFCGIGNPDSFFRRLEAHGLRLAGRRVFRDHHAYRAADLERLAAGARAAGAAALVTTQKDAVKLASLPPPDLPVFVLKIRAALRSGGDDLSRVLDNALRHRP